MKDSRKREIRIKADSFREKCKISRYGIMDLFRECERCGYKLIRYPLEGKVALGFATKMDEDIVIYTNSFSRLSREIFTLAHEIGHVILHFGEKNSFIDDNTTIAGNNIDEKEQEANYFAACLLMPADIVSKFLDLEMADQANEVLSAMDIARIMSEFSVSFDMALNRLENLKKIDVRQKMRLDNEKTEKKVGNLLRSASGNVRLNMRSKEIGIPYEYIDYVIYNYNHNAIPRETLEKALECYQLSYDDICDKINVPSMEDDDDLEELIGGLED